MRAAALWLGLLLAGPALAQEVTLEPSAAQRCLTPVPERRGTPEYPPLAFQRGETGLVKVELVFDRADSRPDVKVLEQEGDDSFVAAVKAHVRDYRVPCLGGQEPPARLLFSFVFTPGKRGVLWSAPIDADAAQRKAMLSCLRHKSGNKAPAFPRFARQAGVQGRVLARLRFRTPDQPPEAEVFARPQAKPLARAVAEWVDGYRLPCFSGEPLEAVWTFVFVYEGEHYGFSRPLMLQELLPTVRGIHTQALDIDSTTMGCPFDVKFKYRRPFLPNAVGELAAEDTTAPPPAGANPARRPLLDWLAQLELDVPASTLDSVFGDSVTLTIPCIKINLNPKE